MMVDQHDLENEPEQTALEAAAKQYEEYLRLAELTDVAKVAALAVEPESGFQPAPLTLVVIPRLG